MPDNTGLLLLGLGALLFLGRGGVAKAIDEDNRFLGDLRGGGPMPPAVPAFNIQSYVDTLFRDTATVPVQPPMKFFYPPPVVVSSSGVPGVTVTAPDIITPTTTVQIGGDGGETITASALAVKRTEQIKQQEFEAAANVDVRTSAPGDQHFWAATVEANRIEEERQRKFAADLIAKNRAAQAKTREAQEAVISIAAPYQPTINFNVNDDDWTRNQFSKPGQSISVIDYSGIDDDADDGFTAHGTYSSGVSSVDFSSISDDEFVISGGMDSPMVFAGEEDDIAFTMEPAQAFYGRYGGEE